MWKGTRKGVLQSALDKFYPTIDFGKRKGHPNVVPLPIVQVQQETPIIFCGLNPSYTESMDKNEGTILSWDANKEFNNYLQSGRTDKKLPEGHYPTYFYSLRRLFKKLCEKLKLNTDSDFFHMDIYPVRLKNSKNMNFLRIIKP